jgi:hypothetical protein
MTPVSAPRMWFYYAHVHSCAVETRARLDYELQKYLIQYVMPRRKDMKSLQEQGLAPTKRRNVRVVFAKQAQNILHHVTSHHLEHESFAGN